MGATEVFNTEQSITVARCSASETQNMSLWTAQPTRRLGNR
jgi:hypothetical protein